MLVMAKWKFFSISLKKPNSSDCEATSKTLLKLLSLRSVLLVASQSLEFGFFKEILKNFHLAMTNINDSTINTKLLTSYIFKLFIYIYIYFFFFLLIYIYFFFPPPPPSLTLTSKSFNN